MISALLDLIDTALSWLPQSPFPQFATTLNQSSGLGWVNWFFPVGRCIEIMAAWLAAILLYYLATILLRWVKAIQ